MGIYGKKEKNDSTVWTSPAGLFKTTVQKYVELKLVEFVNGKSSTLTIEKIQQGK